MIVGENLSIRTKVLVLAPMVFLFPHIIPTHLGQIFVLVSF